jgi:uncharacterized protein YegP (UPF0339 family)
MKRTSFKRREKVRKGTAFIVEMRKGKEEWYWVLRSGGNYEDLATSRHYSSKQGCKETALMVARSLKPSCALICEGKARVKHFVH